MAGLNYTPYKTGETILNKSGDIEYITFKAFEAYPEILCAFSTRKGGVSSGMFSSMNLGRMELDSRENVLENYNLFARAVGTDCKNFVISDQQHTANIKIVSEEDRGKGLFKDKDYEAVDGFITDKKDVVLCLLFADCVPVFLYDPDRHVISLVHSGWKGTAANISLKAVNIMHEKFGSDPADIISVIAPSICASCYEVSADLYEAFSENFSEDDLEAVFKPEGNGKFLLDLWKANRIILLKAGLKQENIHITDLCTSCNKEILFSHRALQGKRGNLAGVIMLRSSY